MTENDISPAAIATAKALQEGKLKGPEIIKKSWG